MAHHVYVVLLTLFILFGTSVQQSTTCPDDWSQFQNSCYLDVEQWITFDEANARCADQGAILAEPDTTEKVQYLRQIIDSWQMGWHTWVGATDRQTEGTWVWSSSGGAIDTSLYAPNQPDAWRSDENCLILDSNGWFDHPCPWHSFYICEKQATV